MYIDETSLYATAQSEPLPVVRRVRRLWTGGGPQRAGRGHIVTPRAQLVIMKVIKIARQEH